MVMVDSRTQLPIGVFDSGIGGLTIARSICKLLPHEDILYFGDTARLPYGSKSRSTIIRFSIENAVFLSMKGVKVIVVACNTVSAVSLDALRSFISIPVLGVVESGALGAVRATKTKRIGVIGTKTTVSAQAYSKAIHSLEPDAEVFEIATPLLVHLVEENWIEREITLNILKEYLAPLFKNDIDTLVLGCTHYPFLASRIHEIAENVKLVDAGEETATLVLNTLRVNSLVHERQDQGRMKVFLSDSHPDFSSWASNLLGMEIVPEISHSHNFS